MFLVLEPVDPPVLYKVCMVLLLELLYPPAPNYPCLDGFVSGSGSGSGSGGSSHSVFGLVLMV